MNKVMTRTAQRHPASRPPSRRDTRRPGGSPPRAQGTGPARSASAVTRTGPARSASAVTRPLAVPQPRPTDLFADRLLLVLSGRRPVHAMLGYTAGPAYDDLARLAEHGPLRARGPRPVIRDIGYCEPRPGAIEAFARIGTGDRLRAMAFRLELGRDNRWRCTAVELGGTRAADDD
ncbi:Rv3235 family protein [Streptomyces chromofuscus]|uniref:Uncharacterized protein n=1 Tax=Streptomyces chromofuscus TaxID=42881 RepID=A0A7M2TE04_STRCW|nr:Rv3235 family protein [Streptomyces chromofuscus]QOV46976.1 hypothetical protein IPT68_14505 [Streptomyces chromofuscus]GGT15020.1 hypothetical protein GCM10010254_39690 [Streptomyces chromofuscus]